MPRTKASSRQIALLAVLVVVLVVVAVLRLRPALVSGGVVGGDRTASAGSYTVPSMGWDRNAPRTVPTPSRGRNLFTFGPPPTPTPDTRPTPTPAPTMPPRVPRPVPTPAGLMIDGQRYPPPPRFTLPYLGWLGPDRLPVAVFRSGDDVLAIPEGGTVGDTFVVQDVGPDFVIIGYVGYPTSIHTKVALSR